MWVIADYQPVSLFSLRMGLATSTGAKTLFLPTPFTIRTALLDAAIRTRGVAVGPEMFEKLKTLSLAVRPPERVVVTNLFTKVQKPRRTDQRSEDEEEEDEAESPGSSAMQKTIAFREYTYLVGGLGLAFSGDEPALRTMAELLPHVNYFGKRGSFFQLLDPPKLMDVLPEGFVLLDGVYIEGDRVEGQTPRAFVPGIIQMMDDWGRGLTFEKINVYTDEPIRLGKDRVLKSVVLPYRLVRSSKSFSFYERIVVRGVKQ